MLPNTVWLARFMKSRRSIARAKPSLTTRVVLSNICRFLPSLLDAGYLKVPL